MITSASPSVRLFGGHRSEKNVTCQLHDGRRVTLTAAQWAEVERGARVSERGTVYWPTPAEIGAEVRRKRRFAELRSKYPRPPRNLTKREAAELYPKGTGRYAELVTHFYNLHVGATSPVAVGLAVKHYEPWTDDQGQTCVFHAASLSLADRVVARVCHHRNLQLDGARLRIESDIQTGLWATVRLPDTRLARAVAASMAVGRLSAFSVGVTIHLSRTVGGVREIHSATVEEISFCHQGRVGSCGASLYGADDFNPKRGSVRDRQLRDWIESEIDKADAARRINR